MDSYMRYIYECKSVKEKETFEYDSQSINLQALKKGHFDFTYLNWKRKEKKEHTEGAF